MKKTMLLVWLLLSLSAHSKVLIITDIDDTIKQTNVLNGFSAFISIFGGTPSFNHMNTVFKEIAEHHSDEKVELTYVSGSVKCLTNQTKWLSKKEFPKNLVMQRRCNNGEFSYKLDTKAFKVKAISSILRQLVDTDNDIYFFGDDGQHDPHIYKEIQELFPQYTYHVFIRDIAAKAYKFHEKLEPVRVEKNNYFLTELDLFNHPDFAFLSDELKSALLNDLKEDKLFAKYLDNNLAKRLHKEAGFKKKESKKLAQDILRRFYAN